MNIAKTKQEKLHLRRAAKTTLKNFRIIKYNDKRTKCKIESAITELTRIDEEFGELLSLRFLKNFDTKQEIYYANQLFLTLATYKRRKSEALELFAIIYESLEE